MTVTPRVRLARTLCAVATCLVVAACAPHSDRPVGTGLDLGLAPYVSMRADVAHPAATQPTSAGRKQPAELTFTGCLHEESPETSGAGRTTHYVLHDLAHATATEDAKAAPATGARARLIIANDSTIRRLIGSRVQVIGRPGDFDATTRSPELHVTSLRGIDGPCAAPEPVP